jgi:ribosomal protein S18 acetylase RimI-like enzyme
MITKFDKYYNYTISIENRSNEHYSFLKKYFDIPFSFVEYINNNNIYIITVRIKDELIGVELFRMKDNKIHLTYTLIEEEYRNKGINTNIKKAVINFAKNNNVNLITANVRKSNMHSLKTFLSTGFKINDSVKNTYPDGEEKIPLYLKVD